MTLRGCAAILVTGVCISGAIARPGAAQRSGAGRSEVFAGSSLESYLRYLQTLERSSDYPVSIRAFSPREVDSLAPNAATQAWAGRYFPPDTLRGFHLNTLRMSLSVFANTAFPFGGNDGVLWKGRGFTTAISGGVAVRWRGLSAVLAPVAFRAENATIPLVPNGQTGALRFADWRWPLNVDKPQAFGTSAYGRLDLGESTLRVDLRGFAAGVSTASQWWGPTSEFPVLLGNNAGGFPHAFIGTARPARVGPIRVHGRLVYGYLDQSAFSPVTGAKHFVDFTESGTRRFMSGVVAVAQLRGVRGFEVGGARFFHAANHRSGVTSHNLLLPIQGLFKFGLPVEEDTAFGNDRAVKENQLASVFLRIAPPGSGFDVYIEHGREDHSENLFDYVLEPDHSSLTTSGFRKAWFSPERLSAIRAEILTYDAPSALRLRPLGQGGAYTHSTLRQGHTHRGQLLGSDVGPGSGNAQFIAFEQFTARGRFTGWIRRVVAHESIERYDAVAPVTRPVEVMNTLGVEVTRFRGALDITVNGSLTLELNRNLESDKTNAALGVILSRRW